MAVFERKTVPFLHKGMNWNSPVEKLPDGQVSWAKNVRVLEQGTVSSAHGHIQIFGPLNSFYIHSISRLNILNTQQNADGSLAFSPDLGRTYVMGSDRQLYVFQDNDTLLNPAFNPVITPEGKQWDAFSGKPLSVVDAQPAGAAVAWKYIADSQQMVTVGYYPGDVRGGTMARALTIGLDPPVNLPALNAPHDVGTGNLTGKYQWAFAYRRSQTGARSNPSAASRVDIKEPSLSVDHAFVSMTLPEVPLDPLTGAPDFNVVVDVYRFGGLISRWALVGSGHGGETFNDNIPDLQLLAAPSPPQVTDPTTGLTRYNLFRPFITQDIARDGLANLSQDVNGAYLLTFVNGDEFNPQWLQGTTIYLGTTACTTYQVRSNTVLEIANDLGPAVAGGVPAVPLGPVNWSTNAGTLMAGQPLSHIWGVYGVGQSGSYIFGCGDPNGRGTLYWTNGNDPDSTDIVNNIIVTSPSEKLMAGAIYDGQPYCWSTERQFQIFPSLTVFGQFTAQEIAGAKGVWMEWSLSVQSNGITDQSVSWRGKDGIYDWSTGGGLQRLTDPLYRFFPHDNNPGLPLENILPFIGPSSRHPEHVGQLDDTQPEFHRLCWFQGLLYYDFVAKDPAGASVFSTLVWDGVNTGGWVSLDQPFPDTTRPVARGIDIGANDPNFDAIPDPGTTFGPMGRGGSLKVSWGDIVFDYFGVIRGFPSRFITRAEDLGDPRLQKLWGDYWIDCTPLSSFTIYPLVGFNQVSLLPATVPVPPAQPGVRGQFPLDFQEFVQAGGKGLLSPTLGLDVEWIGDDGELPATLNEWQPSFVAKPELIEFRATDRDDQGVVQAKYLMGCNIEADTRVMIDEHTGLPLAVPINVQTVQLNVIIDGQQVTQLLLYHDGQTIRPYAWEPVAGYEFQVQFQFEAGSLVWWQLYKVNWIFQTWPDAVARKYPFQNLGTSGAKYIRGIVMPMETAGSPGTVNLWGDDADTDYTWTKTTENLKKSGEVLDLPAPFVAHILQFSTRSACRIWPDEVKIDFDPWPEMSTDVSAFSNLGYVGAKFMQGAVIPMETGGKPVTLQVNSDCGQSVRLGPVSTPPLCKNQFAFSFSPCNPSPSDPFIAHEVQVVPDGDVRIWYDEIKWVWEPEPEEVATWVTQPTNHDFATWHHHRDCLIAYRGGAGTPTLYITTEYGTEAYPLDPVVPNQYVRSYRVLKPQKAKWRSYRVEGCGRFRLYIKDCSVRVKEWGSVAPYVNAQPFGDLSRSNGGARI